MRFAVKQMTQFDDVERREKWVFPVQLNAKCVRRQLAYCKTCSLQVSTQPMCYFKLKM